MTTLHPAVGVLNIEMASEPTTEPSISNTVRMYDVNGSRGVTVSKEVLTKTSGEEQFPDRIYIMMTREKLGNAERITMYPYSYGNSGFMTSTSNGFAGYACSAAINTKMEYGEPGDNYTINDTVYPIMISGSGSEIFATYLNGRATLGDHGDVFIRITGVGVAFATVPGLDIPLPLPVGLGENKLQPMSQLYKI